MFRFILKIFSFSTLFILQFTLWSPKTSLAQINQSVTLFNELTVGTHQSDWIQWNPRIRSTTKTSIFGFNIISDVSLSAGVLLHDETGFQAFSSLSVQERVSIKELSLEKRWESIDLTVGMLNIQWGLQADGPTSQFFGRADLSQFTMTDQDDLPLGQPALQSVFYLGANQLEFLVTPYPYPSPLPNRGSRWDFITEPEQANIDWNPKRPPWGIDQLQFAIRFGYKKAFNWQAEAVVGRWTGSFPIFGFELTETTPELLFTLKEHYTPNWVAGASIEWLPTSQWIVRSDHLFRFNREHIQLPFTRKEALQSLADPFLASSLIPQLLNSPNDHLAKGLQSNHTLSAERIISGWTLTAGVALTTYSNLNERSLRESSRNSILFSARKFALRDQLQLILNSQWNLDPFDMRIHPSSTWQSQDRWAITAGVQLFGGQEPEPLFPDLSYYTFRESGFAYIRFILFAL